MAEGKQSEALKGLEAALDVDPEIQARTPADEGEAAGLDFVDFEESSAEVKETAAESKSEDAELLSDRKKTVRERASKAACYSIAFYQPYFNVDTDEVIQRILSALWPKRGRLFFDESDAELYGPFWVTTSLIFLMAASAHFAQFLEEYTNFTNESDYNWMYDYNKIPVGAATFYGYTVLIPLVMWGISKYYSLGLKLVVLIGLIGYMFTVYIPISVLCFIPSEIVRWLLVLFALGHTGWYCWVNFGHLLAEAPPKVKISMWIGLAVANVALALLLKLYFFSA